MDATTRIKCPQCGEANNAHFFNQPCKKCGLPLPDPQQGSIYIYRQGSFFGCAGAFGIYINGEPYGHIGNTELIRIPVPFGTYNIHSAVGMNRKCQDLLVTVSPQYPVAYTKVYMKMGFWTNSFVIEPLDPRLLEMN